MPCFRFLARIFNSPIILWSIIFLFGEKIVIHLWTGVKWPVIESKTDHHILVIADPQLVDGNCYQDFVKLRAIFSDVLMKRTYKILINYLDPQTVIFLGDLLDGGREWEDGPFEEEMKRFWSIFYKDKREILYHPGNHDIGVGYQLVLSAAERFKQTYSTDLQYTKEIQDVILVSINSPGLVEIESNPMGKASSDFVNSFSNPQNKTVIALSHIPFYRPENTYCGPLRWSRLKSITQFRGYQYQNMLTEQVTEWLLDKLQPSLILSGDDHDICSYLHRDGIQEETIATFNNLQGTYQPGYLLVTINGGKFKYAHGLLPPHVIIIAIYVVTGFLLLIGRFIWILSKNHGYLPLPVIASRNPKNPAVLLPHVFVPIFLYAFIVFFSHNF